jgi:alpha-glucosidase
VRWWQSGVLYQIYPRSFQDTNGDGVGDLEGILARLPHLVELGVDALWLSPIFPSPMADFGYDIENYTDIAPLFGSLADFDALLAAAHRHGLKLLLDLVPNHTSDRHRWFLNSRRSRDDPQRDWYIWRDPAPGGGPPNNWMSEFGGSAWQLDERTGQYYYHAFLKQQPDLNWRNPQVRAAMADVMRFWLARGVDGFRVDVIWHLIKDELFRDNPPNPGFVGPGRPPHERLVPLYTTDRPEIHDVVAELRRVVDEFDDRVLIGEIYLPVERLVRYYGADLRGAHLPFNFQLVQAPWDAAHIARLIEEYEQALPEGAWPNWVLGNHDQHRIASRVGRSQARVAAMLLLTLRGTPTLYYGDEIGMQDVEIPPQLVRDPFERNVPGRGLGRDPERTPMQWSAAAQAGFTRGKPGGEPWLPVAPDYRDVNVETQRADARSMLTLYRRLIALRRSEPALETGSFEPVSAPKEVLAYVRRSRQGNRVFLIALNFGAAPRRVPFPGWNPNGVMALSTHLDRADERIDGALELRPDEGVIVRLVPG